MSKVSPDRNSNNNPGGCASALVFYLVIILGLALVLKAYAG